MSLTTDEDPAAPGGLGALGDYLLKEPLRNSIRVLLLLSLGMNQGMSFMDLLKLTQVSKGSLGHHLEQLEQARLVRSRMVFTLAGPRLLVEITAEGRRTYEELLRLLGQLGPGSR